MNTLTVNLHTNLCGFGYKRHRTILYTGWMLKHGSAMPRHDDGVGGPHVFEDKGRSFGARHGAPDPPKSRSPAVAMSVLLAAPGACRRPASIGRRRTSGVSEDLLAGGSDRGGCRGTRTTGQGSVQGWKCSQPRRGIGTGRRWELTCCRFSWANPPFPGRIGRAARLQGGNLREIAPRFYSAAFVNTPLHVSDPGVLPSRAPAPFHWECLSREFLQSNTGPVLLRLTRSGFQCPEELVAKTGGCGRLATGHFQQRPEDGSPSTRPGRAELVASVQQKLQAAAELRAAKLLQKQVSRRLPTEITITITMNITAGNTES